MNEPTLAWVPCRVPDQFPAIFAGAGGAGAAGELPHADRLTAMRARNKYFMGGEYTAEV